MLLQNQSYSAEDNLVKRTNCSHMVNLRAIVFFSLVYCCHSNTLLVCFKHDMESSLLKACFFLSLYCTCTSNFRPKRTLDSELTKPKRIQNELQPIPVLEHQNVKLQLFCLNKEIHCPA